MSTRELKPWQTKIAQQLGRRGGLVRSEAKAAAARENGKKGGRPRKEPVPKPCGCAPDQQCQECMVWP